MRSMPKSTVIAALALLFLCLPMPALADWNMAKPLKDLLARRAAQAEQKKNEGKQPQATAAPRPARFHDNGDGTLTDRRTGLIWLKTANCASFFEGDQSGGRNSRSWHEARVAVSRLADGFCDLKDGSKAGDWRLPTRDELLDISKDPGGKEAWTAGDAFTGLQSFYYWSATLGDLYQDYAFYVSITYGMDSHAFQLNSFHVLPLRERKKPAASAQQ